MRIVFRFVLPIAAAVSMLHLSGCSKDAPTIESKPKLELVSLHPGSATAGKVFNAQSNGLSGLAVTCRNATKNTEIVFGGQALSTTYGGPELLTTTIPAEMTAQAREVPVILRDGNVESNPLTFTIVP